MPKGHLEASVLCLIGRANLLKAVSNGEQPRFLREREKEGNECELTQFKWGAVLGRLGGICLARVALTNRESEYC